MTDRLAYRVPEVCAMLGISRATLYRRIKTGDLALTIHKLGSVSLVVKPENLSMFLSMFPRALGRDRQKRGETACDTKPMKPLMKMIRRETV
jgi:hypothetical protein